jgi:hypothetical protein
VAERYHIPLYLEDAISLVLEARDDRPLEAIQKYFNSVLQVILLDIYECGHLLHLLVIP